ncbi:MAG: hypothetical protein V4511_03025 [Bacteroidota bacterium]
MKKLLAIAAIALGLIGCKKEEAKTPQPNGTMIFYKTSNTENWALIWSGVEVGQLKYAAQSPPCGAAGFITKDVTPGTYTIDFKSYSGLAWGSPKTITIESGKCKFYPY